METPAGKLRIVFLDAATIGDIALEPFFAEWDLVAHPTSSPDQVPLRLGGFQVAIVNKVRLDRPALESEAAAGLRLIAVAATGTDNVDLEAARERKIAVANVPGYATQAVAQFTVALILELASWPGHYAALVRAGAWEKSPIFTRFDFPSFELAGKKLGIVGYGRIGRAVARMAEGLGMEILVAARRGQAPGGERVPFEELLGRSDFVTLHCPLTPETRNLIDRAALARMKPSACLINTSRGGLVDEQALISALRAKRLRGAAIDALTQEPPSADHPVIRATKELPNLLVTPHCAWTARETRERLVRELAENIRAFAAGHERNRVV
jgi:glycerate dehydrogenase